MYKSGQDGTPDLFPTFYLYPEDKNTYGLDLQYFFGEGILVAPILEEGSTSVDIYLPKDIFYDWYTHKRIRSSGGTYTLDDYDVTSIPLLIRSGVIIPLRSSSANTTAELREKTFELLVPLNSEGKAQGQLYIDDGVSIEQEAYTLVEFTFEDGTLEIKGTFGYQVPFITKITILGLDNCKPKTAKDGKASRSFNGKWSLGEASSIKLTKS